MLIILYSLLLYTVEIFHYKKFLKLKEHREVVYGFAFEENTDTVLIRKKSKSLSRFCYIFDN